MIPSKPKPQQKLKRLPLTIVCTEKFQVRNGKIFQKKSSRRNSETSSAYNVEILNAKEASLFDIDGELTNNGTVKVGFELPKEIIAVVRPKFTETFQPGDPNQRHVIDKGLKMHLAVKILDFVPSATSVQNVGEGARDVYNRIAKASSKQQTEGLYCFPTKGNQLEHLFHQMGTYMFHFSLVGSKYGGIPPSVLRINVAPNNALIPECEVPHHIQKKKHLPAGHDVASQIIIDDNDDNDDDDDADIPLHPDKTIIHVTTLDELVQVNTWFAIAIFLGYAFNPPLPSQQVAISLAPPRAECYVTLDVYRNVVYWEIVSFGFFLFSTMVAHGFKLLLVLGNAQQSVHNSKTAMVNFKFLQFGIWSCLLGTIVGSIFMIVSMLYFIQVRLGSITCGNPWALWSVIIPSVLGYLGVVCFSYTVIYESVITIH